MQADAAIQLVSGSAVSGALLAFLERYLAIVAVGLLLLLLVAGTMRSAVTEAGERPLASVGAGVLTLGACILAALAIGFIATVLVLEIVGGDFLPLNVLAVLVVAVGVLIVLGVLGLLLLVAAYAIVATLLGRLLLHAMHWAPDGNTKTAVATGAHGVGQTVAGDSPNPFVGLLVGALLVGIASGLEGFAGTVVDVVVLLLGLGAASLALRRHNSVEPASIVVTAAPTMAGADVADFARDGRTKSNPTPNLQKQPDSL
jgi:hypothetical protein